MAKIEMRKFEKADYMAYGVTEEKPGTALIGETEIDGKDWTLVIDENGPTLINLDECDSEEFAPSCLAVTCLITSGDDYMMRAEIKGSRYLTK